MKPELTRRALTRGLSRLGIGVLVLTVALAASAALSIWTVRPATAQEAEGPFLRLLTVSEDAYPVISVLFDARNENGAPFGTLNTGNLTVETADTAVTDFDLQQDEAVGLDLVLALDQSTSAEDWAATQSMIESALALLRAEDRVAITTFADEVELIQDFTSDFDAALDALNAITPGGQFSASYPAMLDGVDRLAALDSPRGVVIVLADAPDNISQQSPEQVLNAAQAAGVSVAVASYGPGQNVAAYDLIAGESGGRRAASANVDDLQTPIVQWVNAYLPAWRLEFASPIEADNENYPLTLSYATEAGATSVTGEFTAQIRDVEVELLGLEPDQPVSGIVDLAVTATTPAQLAQVEYRVDGQAVGATDTLDPFAWDTSIVEPGARVVEVTVTDAAGNTGSDTVPVQVIQPAVRLTVTAVEAETFPQVVVYADAFGPNGLPLVGLDAGAFQVEEEGSARAPDELTVAEDTSQPLGLVLVLDRSVSVADWAQLRAAANTLIDTLQPGDEVAIYAFAQDVSLVQNATANHGAAKAALAGVEAFTAPVDPDEAGTNALYPALLDAANLADVLPQSRVAVVAVTDGLDDTGQLSVGELTGVLGGQDVPVHLLAFGAEFEDMGLLSGLAELTGGNALQVNAAAELRNALQTMGTLLRSGYRLTYTSSFSADGTHHELTLRLASQGQEATATGSFTAQPGEVDVTVPNIEPGATVAGAVNLTAQAEAPAQIASVVYRLNGDVLAEVEDIDFTVRWNSDTVDPGSYTLTVTVIDTAGNSGETMVDFVVVAPITLDVEYASSALAQEVEVGERVDLDIDIEAVTGDIRVEAGVNGQVVGTDDRPPYQISFNTNDFAAGEQTITVVASVAGADGETYQAVEELTLNLVEAGNGAAGSVNGAIGATGTDGEGPAGGAGGFLGSINLGEILRWLGIVGVGAVLLGFLWWFLAMIRRSRRTRKLTPVRMSLSNTGNAPTAYLLRGDDESRVLTFEFWYNGHQLGLPPVARLEAEPVATQAAQGSSRYAPAPVQATPPRNGDNGSRMPQGEAGYEGEYMEEGAPEQGGTGGGIGSTLAGLGGRVQEAGMVASIIASILTSIALFLPRNLSGPVRRLAMTIRRGTMMSRRVSHVQRQVGRLNKTEMGSQMIDRTQQGATQVGEFATAEETRQAVADAGRTAQGAMVGAAGTAAGAAGSAAATAQRSAQQTVQQSGNRLANLSGAWGQARSAATGAAAGVVGSATGVFTGANNRQWVYVPQMQPGETATIDIMVGGVGKNQATGHYPFRLISRALDDEASAQVVEEGSVRIQGAPWWRRYLWALLSVILALVVVLIALIWLF